ncbi:unnamed protein product [Gongylonema pulchrum]|uniref:MAM domain-containing protein n=1 Tax=Gongylonema pulchrum TaxID=637853 RepID=A0A183D0U5_9BILA|nr:unnamed protein product [Gongylonema pulchrum]
MLSFLSMILSSGTVLRSDSEEWSSKTYPDPRLNFTQCRTWSESTLCDPDHILTDQWRMDINSNINLQNKCSVMFLAHLPAYIHVNSNLRALQTDLLYE